jgi:hypothetical protein
MGFFTNILLRVATKSGWTTKGSNLTATEVDTNFINFADEINSRDAIGTYTTWTAGTTQAGRIRIYTGSLWLCVNTTTDVPSTSSVNWQQVNNGVAAHERNSDTILAQGLSDEITAAQLKSLWAAIKPITGGVIFKATGNTLNTAQVKDYKLTYVGDTWVFEQVT